MIDAGCAAKVSLSQELAMLAARSEGHPIRLLEILSGAHGRGYDLLLVLLSLPFLTPVPVPGLSTFFGIVVALIGARLALGKKPWLPQRLLSKELPPRFLGSVLRAASKILRLFEFFLKPRLVFMHDHFVFRRLAGILITLSGIFLLAPLPVPFTNLLPAWTVVLLAAGALERDGLFFLIGCVSFLATLAFFVLIAIGGVQAVDKLWQLLGFG